jgi:hypothetical protein
VKRRPYFSPKLIVVPASSGEQPCVQKKDSKARGHEKPITCKDVR